MQVLDELAAEENIIEAIKMRPGTKLSLKINSVWKDQGLEMNYLISQEDYC